MSHSIDGDDDSAVCRVLSPNSLSLVPVKLEECSVVDTAFDPRGFDPRTEDSVPSVLPDDATATGADVAVEAAETRLTARAVRELLAALGGSIGDEDELVVLLQRAVEIANDAIDGADSIGVTIDLAGQTYTAVHTDSRTLRVDIEQYDAGDGPCLHAARTGETVVVDAETSADRWPRFAAAAKDEGIKSFLAAPLFTPDQRLGSFNLYGRAPAAFDSVDAEVMEILTTTVSRAIGDFSRFKSAKAVADALQRALETRAPIEQAKGMLMAIHRIDADTAFHMLRRQSQTTNTKLRDVAAEIVETYSAPPTAV